MTSKIKRGKQFWYFMNFMDVFSGETYWQVNSLKSSQKQPFSFCKAQGARGPGGN